MEGPVPLQFKREREKKKGSVPSLCKEKRRTSSGIVINQ